jgi:NADH-quinone oxidoreductase subunit L
MTIPLMVLAALSALGGLLLLGGWITDWLAPVVGQETGLEPGIPAILLSLIILVVVAVGVALAWVFVAKRDVPREAPQRVSFVTRAARADLYGDALNESLLMRPGDQLVDSMVGFDDHVVDGTVNGTGGAALAMSGTFRKVQSGYVRSYALSVLAGAFLVVLALLAVNFA